MINCWKQFVFISLNLQHHSINEKMCTKSKKFFFLALVFPTTVKNNIESFLFKTLSKLHNINILFLNNCPIHLQQILSAFGFLGYMYTEFSGFLNFFL